MKMRYTVILPKRLRQWGTAMTTESQERWNAAKDELVGIIVDLGLPEEFGYEIAKGLGSPQAMHRMTTYLKNTRPKSPEPIVDEMLAIRSQIDSWKEKKKSEEANARYNEILRYGLDD